MVEPDFFVARFGSSVSMANHWRSWHLLHSTWFSPTKVKLRPWHVRQATRSTNLRRSLGTTRLGWVSVTARSRLKTSIGEIAPAFRLMQKLGNSLVSTNFHRIRKLMTRVNVSSSKPEASLSALVDFHSPLARADHTVSRNISSPSGGAVFGLAELRAVSLFFSGHSHIEDPASDFQPTRVPSASA